MGTRPGRAVTREFIGGGVHPLISVLPNELLFKSVIIRVPSKAFEDIARLCMFVFSNGIFHVLQFSMSTRPIVHPKICGHVQAVMLINCSLFCETKIEEKQRSQDVLFLWRVT